MVQVLPILHIYSDLVRQVRICLTPLPPLSEKIGNWTTPLPSLLENISRSQKADLSISQVESRCQVVLYKILWFLSRVEFEDDDFFSFIIMIFFSFVTIWVLEFSQLKILSFVTTWLFQFCHNLSWVFWQFKFLGFVTITSFKYFFHSLSFWALSQCQFWVLSEFKFLSFVSI